jgi:NAD(P)-dependent dehydrogenase (short-subunit alcohol dehydrogenase family)
MSAEPETGGRSPVVVVTGASAGIGRAIAVAFAGAGFDVGLLARGRAGLDGAAAEVEQRGRRALALPCDVADHAQVARAAERAEAELGPIDVWVNNAMTTAFAPSWELRPEDFQRAVEVTFLGQVWGTLVALEHFRPRDRGTIVDVGSALSFLGIPLQSAYCSSKFACRGFFESVRAELLHEGSNVVMSMVHPPAVNTPQFSWCLSQMGHHPQPVPPIYQPEVVAASVLAAARDGRRSKVVGSWNRVVVAAGKYTPGLGNHFASLGAWESQLTDRPTGDDRPANLRRPADEDEDFGAHGVFDDASGGFWDPSYLRSLPSTAATMARAGWRTGTEKLRWVRRRFAGPGRHLAPSGTAGRGRPRRDGSVGTDRR